MKQKKIPLRKCTGCNEMKGKRELIRVVKAPEKTDENGNVIYMQVDEAQADAINKHFQELLPTVDRVTASLAPLGLTVKE